MKREIEFLPIKTYVFDSPAEALESAAREMANWIRTRKFQRGDAKLGIPSGDVLATFYDKIREMTTDEVKGGLPISGVRTIALGEIVGRGATDSIQSWLVSRFFDPWGAPAENRFFFDGTAADPAAACADFDARMAELGPMDLVLAPLGRNGRLGYNAPGSAADCASHQVELDAATRAELDAGHASSTDAGGPLIFGESMLSMGLATIRAAKRVRIFAFGAELAEAVEAGMLTEFEAAHPLSALAGHKDVELLLDPAAAALLE